MKHTSELRQDLVTGDWIAIATGRVKRPEHFNIKSASEPGKETQKKVNKKEEIENCPFDNLEKFGNKGKIMDYPNGEDWFVRVIPNKYPAFKMNTKLNKRSSGPYKIMDGVGFHEVLIYKDHFKHIYDFSEGELVRVFDVYQSRYLSLMNKKYVDYISIFHNYGKEAGASISHPHSQLIAAPIVPPDIHRSLVGSTEYYFKNKRCVHCIMIDWEKEDKKRIVFENDDFVAFCPFVSRAAFEVRIFPKDHKPYFERVTNEDKKGLAEMLKVILRKINRGLNGSAFNFFIHTAPCDGKDYPHYHWHIEVLPKTSIWAGFELGTGVEISTVEPEEAAKYLRDVK